MLDIKQIRDQPERVRTALLKRMDAVDFTELMAWDEARRTREVEAYLASARREFDVPEPAEAVGTVETVPAGA